MTTDPVPENQTPAATPEQKNIVLLVYILQAASFVVGVSSLAAIIIDYLKRDELRGTWLESHIDWQIKTFWYALAGGIAGAILLVIAIGALVLLAVAVWVIYRIVKGWLAFNDGRELPDALF